MRWLFAAIVTLALLAGRARAETIQDIVVEGNNKTTRDTVTFIAQIDVGDDWKPELVDLIKLRLVNSGLFSEVEAFWEPLPASNGGVRVHILAKDKHSWIIAPAFYAQPTNKGGGLGFGENNLFGANQKLLLYGQIATGDSFFIGAWVLPSIANTPLYAQLDTFLKSSRNIEYAYPTKYDDNPLPVRESRIHYLNAGVRVGIDFFHGIKLDTRLRAATVSYRDVHCAAAAAPGTCDPTMLQKPGKEGVDVSHELALTIDRRANWYGVSTGYRFNAAFEYAVPSLGSDFHYYEIGLQGVRGYQVLERHNLVAKSQLHIGHHMPFQQEFVTGGTSMRGWLNNQFRGDFQYLGNLEYSLPLFTVYGLSMRGLAFFDTAYTTFFSSTTNTERTYLLGENPEARGLKPFKNSIGVGARFYLRQIVLPLLGVDFGYGLEARDLQVYLAIGLTD